MLSMGSGDDGQAVGHGLFSFATINKSLDRQASGNIPSKSAIGS